MDSCNVRTGASRVVAFLAVLAITTVGCDSGPQLAKVSGTVTLDGKPLTFGKVMFQNMEGGQPATSDIGPDGSFALVTFAPGDGAIVGTHRIRVVCYSSQDPAVQAEKGPGGDALGQLLIPERYSSLGASGLTADVPPEGLQGYAIELFSKEPGR